MFEVLLLRTLGQPTAERDEEECLMHFGAGYRTYMRSAWRFIPFVF